MSSLRLAMKQSLEESGSSLTKKKKKKLRKKERAQRRPGDPPRKRGRPRKHPLPEEQQQEEGKGDRAEEEDKESSDEKEFSDMDEESSHEDMDGSQGHDDDDDDDSQTKGEMDQSSIMEDQSSSNRTAEQDEVTARKNRKKILKKMRRNSAANLIQRGWKKTKKKKGVSDKSEAASSSKPEPSTDSPKRQQHQDKEERPSKKISNKSKQTDRVPAPSADVIDWIGQLSQKKHRRYMAQGLRVKVRFATKVKKRDSAKIVRKLKWYGGRISDVSTGGSKIRIKYDDNTSEVAKYPDKDIIVDDTDNGNHEVRADAFIPPPLPMAEDEEQDAEQGDGAGDGNAAKDSKVSAPTANEEEDRRDEKKPASKSDDDDAKDDDTLKLPVGKDRNKEAPMASPTRSEGSVPVRTRDMEMTEGTASVASADEDSKSQADGEVPVPEEISESQSKENVDAMDVDDEADATKRVEQAAATESEKPVEEAAPLKQAPTADSLDTSDESSDDDGPMEVIAQGSGGEIIKSTATKSDDDELKEPKEADATDKVEKPEADEEVAVAAREEEPEAKSRKEDEAKLEPAQESGMTEATESGDAEIVKEDEQTKSVETADVTKDDSGDQEMTEATEKGKDETKDVAKEETSALAVSVEQSTGDEVNRKKDGNDEPVDRQKDRDNEPETAAKDLETPAGDSLDDKEEAEIEQAEKIHDDSKMRNPEEEDVKPTATSQNVEVGVETPKEPQHGGQTKPPTDKKEDGEGAETMEETGEIPAPPVGDGNQFSPIIDKSDFAAQRSGRRAAQQANERIVSGQERVIQDQFSKPKKKRGDKTEGGKPIIGKEKKRKEPDGGFDVTDDDNQWVQCDKCSKWRILPSTVDVEKLPNQWYCEMNTYDPDHNNCSAIEQTPEEIAKKRRKAKKKLARQARRDAEAAAASALGRGEEVEATEQPEPKQSRKERGKSPLPGGKREKPKKEEKKGEESKKRASPTTNESEDDVQLSSDPGSDHVKESKKAKRAREEAEAAGDVAPKGKKRRRGKDDSKESKPKGGKSSGGAVDDSQEWVQCEKCEKWRRLPPQISAEDLPDTWYCTMNNWEPSRARCNAPEDSAEPGTHDFATGTFGGNGNKLSYRSLIFGTGKKQNRPISERQRAAESLFSQADDDANTYPTVMYSRSSMFVNRSNAARAAEGETRGFTFLDLMAKSNLWIELRGLKRQMEANQQPPAVVNSSMPKPVYSMLSVEQKSDTKDFLLKLLGDSTLSSPELLLEAQCSVTSPRVDCTAESALACLLDLVDEGKAELVTTADQAPKFRTVQSSPVTAKAIATTPVSPGLMKFCKPWKRPVPFP